MLTRTKLKAHECDICKKKFSMKGSLVQHFRIHLGEKPYGYSKWEKWLTQICNRNSHISTVHNELVHSEQQSELKCEIPRSFVHNWLNHFDHFQYKSY